MVQKAAATMNGLFRAARQLQEFCDAQGWRSTAASFGPEMELRTCSAEDLIVLKLFAWRLLDGHDAEGVAIRQKGKLDWT